MMPIMDMWATVEPLTHEIKALREEVKELKHERAELSLVLLNLKMVSIGKFSIDYLQFLGGFKKVWL